jgi:hypothetical protein
VEDREDALLTTNTSVPGSCPIHTGGYFGHTERHRIARARNARMHKNAAQKKIGGTKTRLLSIQIKSKGVIDEIDDIWLVHEVETAIADEMAAENGA